MGKKIKRSIVCLIALSMLSAAGTVNAAVEEITDASEIIADTSSDEAEEDTPGRIETAEDAELSADDAQRLLHKIGTADGFDIYRKSKDYEDEIWLLHGGDPRDSDGYDKDAEPTSEQLAAEADIALLKPIGDLVAVDTKLGRAAASFDDYEKSGDSLVYISDAGRYLLYVDEELTQVRKMRYTISTLDDDHLFMTADGKTLELMDDDFGEVIGTYAYSGEKDGKLVYSRTDSDGFAWIGAAHDRVYGTFRYATENDLFRMLVDDRTAIIGLENKATGYIWWSSPLDSTRDELATPVLISELRSSNVLRYGIPESRSPHNYLRSNSSDCEISVKDIQNGIRVDYNYRKAGISYPVEYTIEEDHLRASLKTADIKETNPKNIATEVTLLGSFGAAAAEDEGYFVIPDGSGALINFNNGKKLKNPYSQKVYGSDVTAVPTTKGAVTKQVYLPMYGIVNGGNAMLVVASKGDSNAILNAKVSGQSNSSYNFCNFTFVLRGVDSFYMSGSSKEEFTIFEGGKIAGDDIELRYYPISGEDSDYVDIAERYRQYLIEDKGVSVKAKEKSSPLYLGLYGGVEKKKPFLGIPITTKTSITGYSEAQDIISQLGSSGVDEMVITYNNWTNNGIKNRVDTSAKPSGTLGGKSRFDDLTEYTDSLGYSLYPTSDNRDFRSGNGYYSFTSTAVRISGSYSRIISYDRAYGIPDGLKKNMSLLSPRLFGEVFTDVADSYKSRDLSGVSIGSLTSSLYGDYGKKKFSRYDAMNELIGSYEKLNGSLTNGILAENANAYALPYVSHITNLPLCSSRFDIFDEDIPFYQIVMHGVIPYSTAPINGSADPENLLLTAAASGSNISYDMIYEETDKLKDTDYDVYYYANWKTHIDPAAAEYKLISSILSDVSSCTITDYSVDGDVITTTYSDGTVIVTDLAEKSITANGITYALADIAKEGGFEF